MIIKISFKIAIKCTEIITIRKHHHILKYTQILISWSSLYQNNWYFIKRNFPLHFDNNFYVFFIVPVLASVLYYQFCSKIQACIHIFIYLLNYIYHLDLQANNDNSFSLYSNCGEQLYHLIFCTNLCNLEHHSILARKKEKDFKTLFSIEFSS